MSETPWLIPSGVKIWHDGRAVQPNAEMRRLEGELDKAERRVEALENDAEVVAKWVEEAHQLKYLKNPGDTERLSAHARLIRWSDKTIAAFREADGE